MRAESTSPWSSVDFQGPWDTAISSRRSCEDRSGGEAVADAGVGPDVARGSPGGSILRRRLAMWVRSTCGVVRVLRPPDLDEQRAVGHQPAAVARERAQQVELDRRQVDLLAVAAHGAGGEVDLEAVGVDRRLVGAGAARAAQRGRAAARPARAARTAWSRSRRRPPRARGPSPSSSPTAESTRIGISLHSRSAPADLDAVDVGQHEVDDRRVGRAHRGAVERLLAGRRAGTASNPASRSTTFSARRICGSSSHDEHARRRPLTAPPPAGRGSGAAARRRSSSPGRAATRPTTAPPLASMKPRTIASPRPEPRCRAAPARAVERLEDAVVVGGGMPGPRSTIRTSSRAAASARAHRDRAGRRSGAARSRAGSRTRARAGRRRRGSAAGRGRSTSATRLAAGVERLDAACAATSSTEHQSRRGSAVPASRRERSSSLSISRVSRSASPAIAGGQLARSAPASAESRAPRPRRRSRSAASAGRARRRAGPRS